MALLTMRLFIAEHLKLENPLAMVDESNIKFFDTYLSYLSQLKFDDMAHWTVEQFNFYNSLGYPLD